MGLDMYLTGNRMIARAAAGNAKIIKEEFDLGYWRKHPNLHGYIVNNFSRDPTTYDGGDINLTVNDLLQIIDAIKNRELPHTEGFFFGESATDPSEIAEEQKEDIRQLQQAIDWLSIKESDASRFVYYGASW